MIWLGWKELHLMLVHVLLFIEWAIGLFLNATMPIEALQIRLTLQDILV